MDNADISNTVDTSNTVVTNDCNGIFGPPMLLPCFFQPVTMQGELNLSQ